MADYYPLLERAVAGMRHDPAEKRRAIYDRARQALLGQLRTMHVPEESIDRESSALDTAITRLEADILAPAPQTETATPPTADAPPVAGPSAAAPTVAAASPPVAVPPAVPPPPAAAPTPRPGPARPGAEALTRIMADRAPAPLRATRGDGEAGATAEAPARPTPLPSAPRLQVPSFAEALDAAEAIDDTAATRGDPPAGDADALAREEPVRPPAPRPVHRERFNPRFLILALVGALVVAGIAYAAWRLRDRPELLAKSRAAMLAAQQAEQQSAKVKTRADGQPAGVVPAAPRPSVGAAPASPADAAASAAPPTPPISPAPQASTATQPLPAAAAPTTADTASQPATPPATANAAVPAAADAAGVAADAIPVAQRAAFLVEAPDDPQKIKTYVGTVVWTTENASPAQGQPIARTVHADIDIPDAAIKLAVVFQKNDEAQFPASHTLEFRFALSPSNTMGGIKQINMPQMRKDDSPSGDPLIGLPVTITDNYFLVGLSRGDAVVRNLDLIKTRNWFDVPLLLTSGKVAKVTFEKGTPGTNAIDEVIKSWQ